MNEKLLKLFRILNKQNFVSTFEFHSLIYNSETTEEDKVAFKAWITDNKLNIIDGRSRGLYCFSTENNPMLSVEDLQKTMYVPEDETLEEEPIKILFDELEHIRCTKFDSNYPSGWLNPKGELIECDWGEHESFASDFIRNNKMLDEQDVFEKAYGNHYCGDFLVYKGWVLFDCPSGNCQAVITFKKGKLTKKQKDYIIDYVLKIEDSVNLEVLA
jgi:hypothetical protein